MEFQVDATSPKVRAFFNELMPKFIKELNLTNSQRAVLVKVTDDTPDGINGSTQYIDFSDCYLVLIRSKGRLTPDKLMDMTSTLSHEMIHVRQLAKGIMRMLPGKSKIWRGKVYNGRTKYLAQPWELDAFAKSEIVLRRVLDAK